MGSYVSCGMIVSLEIIDRRLSILKVHVFFKLFHYFTMVATNSSLLLSIFSLGILIVFVRYVGRVSLPLVHTTVFIGISAFVFAPS